MKNTITPSFYRMKTKKTIHQLLCLFVLLSVWNASAITRTSTGGGGTWSTAATWSPSGAPVAGDVVIIAAGSPVNISSVVNLNTIAVTVKSGATLTSGSTTTFGSLTIESTGVFTCTAALTIAGTTDITGTITLTVGATRTDSFADIILNSGAVWTDTGAGARTTTISGNFTNNATTFNITNTGIRTFSGAGKSISGSTITSFPNVAVTGTPTIASGSTLTVTTALTGAGTLTNNGTLNIGGTSTITTLTATAIGNTVNYNGAAAQTVKVTSYTNLILSGSGVKTIGTAANGTLTSGNLSIAPTGSATASVTNTNIAVGSLTMGGAAQGAGTYGSTSSIATYQDNTYFAATTGYVSVAGIAPPVLNADVIANTVDNNIDITFTDDAAWRAAVIAVKIGTTTLTAGTDYVLSAGNLQLKPSGLNVLLTTSGSKSVKVIATGYFAATVTQIIDAGVPTGNSTATISAALAANTSRTITVTAKDQYNNLVSGYAFKYDVAITNNDVTTAESYTIDGIARTTTTNDIDVVTVTNGSGVATFIATLPALIDYNDGISIQVQLNNGTTNIGSAFSYIQLLSQTITFGPLAAVTYGDASFTLTATASSGLTVTYVSSNTAVATISGSTLTIVGAGSANITASQAGNGSYAAAPDVIQTLTVNQKMLTITGIGVANKVYNGTTTGTLTGTAVYVGLVNSESFAVTGIPTATFASANVGTAISVTVSGYLAPSANYSITQPTGFTADITKANQTISFIGSMKDYLGFTDFTPPATSASSGTNTITFVSSNSAVATIVANKVHYIGLGTTTITASQAASANYNAAADASQTLTVMEYPIAAWNFWTSGSTTQTNKTAYIFDSGLDAATMITVPAGTNTAASMSANNITRGSSVPASGGTSAFRSTSFLTNAPTAPPVNAANVDYFQITLQATAGKTVSISAIDAYFYDAGNGFNASPGAISQFGYSLDGGATVTAIGSPVQSTALRMTQIDVSGITALQDVPSGTTITLRYYASGYAAQGWGFGSPNPGAAAGIAATDGLVIGGDVSDSTTWTTGLVWTNGVPSSTKNAIILGAFDTSTSTGGGFTTKKLTVNSGGSLTVKAGTTVTVQNQVINNAGASGIVVEDTGSLVQVNDASVNKGNIAYKRNTTAISNMDYTYWSSPVASFTLGGVSPNTLSDKFYSFDSSIEDWKQESTATVMTAGVGYIIRGPQTAPYMSPSTAIYQATFTGVPNTGHYQITGVLADKSYLLGNPYPSALDADTFIDGNQNVLDGTLYLWTHNTPIGTGVSNPGSGTYAYSGDDYASYNRTGGAGTAAALNTGVNNSVPSGKIASGQGFFASSKVTPTATVIDYYNYMRVGVGGITGNNSQFFKIKKSKAEKSRVWLNLTNTQGLFKQILVGYVTNATNDYDDLFDGLTFNANPFADFYSINQNKKLVIQGRALPFDKNDEVPLGFKTTIDGPLTISIDNADGVLANQKVFLEDRLTNTITDLRKGSYTFNTVPGTFDNRFVLRYANNKSYNEKFQDINEVSLSENSIRIYKSNGVLNVDAGGVIIANVKVYDTFGKLIAEQKNVSAATTVVKELKEIKQVLVFKITSREGEVTTKKVIN